MHQTIPILVSSFLIFAERRSSGAAVAMSLTERTNTTDNKFN